MPSTFDPLLRLELQATGENASTWGIKTNNNIDLIAAAIAGLAIVSVSAGDTTLTAANALTDQARAAILLVEGTLTADANIIVPAASKIYAILRQTSGSFNVIVKNAGTGATLQPSGADIIVCTTATCISFAGALNARIEAVSAAVSVVAADLQAVSAAVSVVATSVSVLSAQVSAINALNIRVIE
jgi:hypothetical protein